MTGWNWWNLIGNVLQLAGILVALVGTAKLHRALTETTLRSFVRAWWRQTWPRMLRRIRTLLPWVKSPAQTTISGVADITLDGVDVGQAFGSVYPPTVSTGDAYQDQINQLSAQIRMLEDQRKGDVERTQLLHDGLQREMTQRFETLTEHVDNVKVTAQNTITAIGGRDGAGVRVAAFGLLVTVVGLAMTTIAAAYV